MRWKVESDIVKVFFGGGDGLLGEQLVFCQRVFLGEVADHVRCEDVVCSGLQGYL